MDTTSLADILERILDKGIVIAGDISISIAQVELLTIKVRLIVCSVDKAQEIGINWWRFDPALSGRVSDEQGEPVPRGEVQAWTLQYADGKRPLSQVANAQTSRLDDGPGVGLVEPGHHLQEGRLTRPVRTAQADALAVPDLPGNAVQEGADAESFGDF
jgi:hypothetical protein